MNKHSGIKRWICQLVAAAFLLTGFQQAAFASMVTTEALAGAVQNEQQREDIRALFSRDDVRKQMTAMGVDPVAALDRVDSLTDSEVAMLHGKLGQLPAGEGAVETVLLVILILLLLELLGVIDIFPRI
jgi:hypothetical protein